MKRRVRITVSIDGYDDVVEMYEFELPDKAKRWRKARRARMLATCALEELLRRLANPRGWKPFVPNDRGGTKWPPRRT